MSENPATSCTFTLPEAKRVKTDSKEEEESKEDVYAVIAVMRTAAADEDHSNLSLMRLSAGFQLLEIAGVELQVITDKSRNRRAVVLAEPKHAKWIELQTFEPLVEITRKQLEKSDLWVFQPSVEIQLANKPIVFDYTAVAVLNSVSKEGHKKIKTTQTLELCINNAETMQHAFQAAQTKVNEMLSKTVEFVSLSIDSFPRGNWSVISQ